MRLPCPQCHRPASIDARSCSCGYLFVADHTPQIKAKLPDLKRIVPELTSTVRKFPQRPQTNENASAADDPVKETVVFSIPEIAEERAVTPSSVSYEDSRDDEILGLNGLTTVVSEAEEDRPVVVRRGFRFALAGAALAGVIAVLGGISAYQNGGSPNLFLKQASVETAPSESAPISEPVVSNGETPPAVQSSADVVADEPQPVDQTINSADSETRQENVKQEIAEGDKVVEERRAPEEPNSASNLPVPESVEKEKRSGTETTTNSAVATAKCADGTFSYRKTRSGACAYRGGVAEWLDGKNDGSSSLGSQTNKQPVKTQTAEKPVEAGRKFVLGSRGGCYYLGPTGNKNYVDKSFCN